MSTLSKGRRLFGAAAAIIGCVVTLVGCASNHDSYVGDNSRPVAPQPTFRTPGHDNRAADVTPRPTPPPENNETPVRMSGDNAVVSLAYPTGERSTSAILVEQYYPRQVRAGQPYDFEIRVTNLTSSVLQNVAVGMQSVENLEIVSSDPALQGDGSGGRQWYLGELAPHATKVIHVTGRANGVGVAANCLTVTYANLLCAQTEVVQPALEISKSGPDQVLLCQNFEYRIEVRNPGSGPATHVVVRDTLPEGLTTADGQQQIEQDLGTLDANMSRAITVPVKASRTGSFSNNASASADGGLSADSNTVNTVVVQPVLSVDVACPDTRYIGRNAAFEITVRNTGDAACDSATLTADFTGGEFASADNNGAASGNSVNWNLGAIAAGQSRTVTLVLSPREIGTASVRATVNCACSNPASDTCETAIRGIPALLLEVVDDNDPVEVGNTTTYIITVTNQGSAPGTGIKVNCELPAEQDFVSAGGATAGTNTGKSVSFAALPSLAPGATATWRVTVRANAPGAVLFRVSRSSNEFPEPAIETETTNLYE